MADPDEASAYRRLADSYPAPTHVEVIESGGRAGAALVRPDGHLGWTGNRGHSAISKPTWTGGSPAPDRA